MNAQPDTVSILIPDGESYIMLGVLRCLSDVKGIRLFVISNNRNTAMRYSRHITSFIYCTKSASVDEWFNLINKLVKKHDIDVILPVFENASQAFLRHRDMFCCDKLLLLPETLDALEVARDKWLLSQHLEKQDLDGPGTFRITEFLNHRSSKAEFYFPLLLKPTAETGDGKGIIKFDAYDDLKRYLKEHTIDPSYILQEYIEGYDLGCNVLCKNGEILAYTIQKGTIFTNRPFSPQVGLKITKDNEVYQRISKLMKSLNWNGVANIDMRYDVKRKKYLILEINTRFWYTVLASSKAGVNFPWLYCL
ncbi:MAG: ATP-grasp domain-containing protein, partial [Robiginitalea sp.]